MSLSGAESEKLPEMQAIAALYRKGDFQTGRMEVVQYLRSHNDNPAAHYLYAISEPDPQKQAAALYRALALDPNYDRAKTRLAKLSSPPRPRRRRPLLSCLGLLLATSVIITVSYFLILEPRIQDGRNAVSTAMRQNALYYDLIRYCKHASPNDDCDAFANRVVAIPEVVALAGSCDSLLNPNADFDAFGACVLSAARQVGQTILPTPRPVLPEIRPTATLSPADRALAKSQLRAYCATVKGMDCDAYERSILVGDLDVQHVLYCALANGTGTPRFGDCIKAVTIR